MNEPLPPAVQAYFDATNAHDAAAIAACFTPDGWVHDEGSDHRGRDAIRAWGQDVIDKYDLISRVTGAEARDDALTVTAEVSGNFDGSPAEITYLFDLDGDGLISAMRVP
jgi:ketosteroid isomerase-like protein